jgi:hypothetical protein
MIQRFGERPVPRLKPYEKREALLKKRAELDAQLRMIETQTRNAERKRDTRRKVIAGAIALEHMKRNPQDPVTAKLSELLNQYVEPRSRDLFPFLPALPITESDQITDQDNTDQDNDVAAAASMIQTENS